eukprot:CAMPEP_0168532602 /NCGR_PEP_ID=MMETSP0405-20121227/16392_1 /TAXON_ID=498012 /ORGANISM="Trichosphaerium sp, Strain Am-I-7 wt" /LENGTH=48 /DNA_ID= /DNA_START= /DNA_END= /DNA_ORIENTATION=
MGDAGCNVSDAIGDEAALEGNETGDDGGNVSDRTTGENVNSRGEFDAD